MSDDYVSGTSFTIGSSTTVVNNDSLNDHSDIQYVATNVDNVQPQLGAISITDMSSLVGITIVNCDNLTAIQDGAFANNPGLSLVHIREADKLESIGEGTFEGCSSLTTVDLTGCPQLLPFTRGVLDSVFGDTGSTNLKVVVSSTDSAWTMTISLTDNTLAVTPGGGPPQVKIETSTWGGLFADDVLSEITAVDLKGCTGLTCIDNSAFVKFTKLGSLDLSETPALTTIGASAFQGCTSLETIQFGNVFPSVLNTIGDGAFRGCTALGSIDLPRSVTSVGSGAFAECSGLGSADWSISKVTSVAADAFRGCSTLHSVILPECLVDIGESAFAQCPVLEVVTLPSSLKSVANTAFSLIDDPTTRLVVKVNPNNGLGLLPPPSQSPSYDRDAGVTVDLMSVELSLDDGVLTVAGDTSTIDAAVWGDEYTLSEITAVDLTGCANLTRIGPSAFVGFTKLETADLNAPELATIGELAFSVLECLKTIHFDTSPSSKLGRIENGAFHRCSRLEKIDIPGSVTHIGASAFERCRNLRDVGLFSGGNTPPPSLLASIGNGAFAQCVKLESLTLPASVLHVGERAFASCTKLRSADLSDSQVTNIARELFSYCSALGSVILPDTATNVGELAFSVCFGLSEITLPPTLENIADDAFQIIHGHLLVKTTSGNKLELMENEVHDRFYLADRTTVVFLDGTTAPPTPATGSDWTIDDATVDEINTGWIDSALLSINSTKDRIKTVGFSGVESLVSIAPGAFVGFVNLERVDFSGASKLRSIGVDAFKVCEYLESVTNIPGSLETIGDGAFCRCVSLKNVHFNNDAQPSLSSVGDAAFHGCRRLESLTLPGSVSHIGDSAFERCTKLRTIDLSGSQVTSLGAYLFSECRALDTIVLPDLVKNIEDNKAFERCDGLNEITLPPLLESITYGAFRALYGLVVKIDPRSDLLGIDSGYVQQQPKDRFYGAEWATIEHPVVWSVLTAFSGMVMSSHPLIEKFRWRSISSLGTDDISGTQHLIEIFTTDPPEGLTNPVRVYYTAPGTTVGPSPPSIDLVNIEGLVFVGNPLNGDQVKNWVDSEVGGDGGGDGAGTSSVCFLEEIGRAHV